MPYRLCIRCRADLHSEDTGALAYCPECGAAQVVLSEDLREQFEQQQVAAQSPSGSADPGAFPPDTVTAPTTDPTAVVWSHALQLIALAGAAFGVLMLIALALPPVGLIALLWVLGAPIVLLGIYSARNSATHITTGFGARLGLLTGLSIGLTGVFANLLSTLITRFILRQGATIDAQFASSPDQMREMMSHFTSDPALVQQTIQQTTWMFHNPEFRIGSMLLGFAMFVLLYAFYSTLTGAFSGLLRSRTRIRR